MSDDKQEPPPLPAPPTLTTEQRLTKIEQWQAVIARTVAKQSLQFAKYLTTDTETQGQIQGALLLIDANVSRILKRQKAAAKASAPEVDPDAPHEGDTDKFNLPAAGISVEVSKTTVRRGALAIKVVKVAYYVGLAIVAATGWIKHLLNKP